MHLHKLQLMVFYYEDPYESRQWIQHHWRFDLVPLNPRVLSTFMAMPYTRHAVTKTFGACPYNLLCAHVISVSIAEVACVHNLLFGVACPEVSRLGRLLRC